MNNKLYLVLENGKTFEGVAAGAKGEATGELVFTTSMAGYNDILTDPSYFGQIVVHTFPISGNYGVVSKEFSSDKSFLKAYIVKDICETPSNFKCEGDLISYMSKNGIIGLCGIDTRELTKILRENGTMKAKITSDISDIDTIIKELKALNDKNFVEKLNLSDVKSLKSEKPKFNVVLWDFGAKNSLKAQLIEHGYDVTVVPYNTSSDDIINLKPDGVIISNGPGNPEDNADAIKEIKKIVDSKIPVFGICLGHQLLALALGAKTEKLKYGHRGSNQPTKCLSNGRVYITNQNHGYTVINDSLPSNATCSFINVNDGTCEGIEYKDIFAFSVQFYPDCCSGPNDSSFLYDKFDNIMKGEKK